jgi:hypothetical protein
MAQATQTAVDAAVARLESLLAELGGAANSRLREKASELVGVLMELYGDGLDRMIGIVRASNDAPALLDRFAEDKLVASLLLVHGLHPVDAETRVRRALDRLARRLDSHRLVLSQVSGGVARVRVEPAGQARRPLSASLAGAVERAVLDAAPDAVETVEVEGAALAGPLVQITIP